jgi:hypothetical protein
MFHPEFRKVQRTGIKVRYLGKQWGIDNLQRKGRSRVKEKGWRAAEEQWGVRLIAGGAG